ncbi:hypothetical protein [Gordonibacter urolithinfaciens]|uniref:hypothetical protein n=1 Tax=Gordonibacter urolithinfaciens TaxID=1335613 RepID=UPI000F4C25E1|nr:hypothetical protein [Gordonibacter urolithinfaciens]ROT93218.1 hypothetical protein DMP13_03025 [Gordonibacter urolithinfaciens]GKG91685.1 hypothetical protein CE91St32_27280 [Gordonibacter pamelaeae]
MKKFIIAAACLFALAACAAFTVFGTSVSIDLDPSKPVTAWVRQEGRAIQIDRGDGWEDFEIRGVDMGAGIPGHFATDYAIDKETYLRWFQQVKDMGANTIRVYILLGTDFYEAFYEFNKDNPDPLYLIHGVWIDDYAQNSHMDAYDPAYLGRFKEDARTVVDVIHGQRWIELGRLSGTGMYTKDISPWVLGYILGVEWEAPTVIYTDRTHEGMGTYHGSYVSSTSEASAFEIMLAQVGDDLMGYESKRYKQQRLLAFSNWPTTDPMSYPLPLQLFFEKYSQVDVENIVAEETVVSGMFASYHVYPYYPDYLQYLPEYANAVDDTGQVNTYRAYLETLVAHHSVPVVISEFGVPSSRGRAQVDANTGRNQGGMSEDDQGRAIVRSYVDIMASGCAGSVIFTWQDEWFKRTWNTMANVDLLKTPYWSDYQTNEQYFGLLSFDPGTERSVSYADGDDEEWTDADVIGEADGRTLSMKYDEKFVYLMVRGSDVGPGTPLYLPVDTTQKTGATASADPVVSFERAADFLIVLDGEDESRVLVQERYEVMRAMALRTTTGEDPYENIPAKDTTRFKHIDLVLQTITETQAIADAVANQKNAIADNFYFESYETGKLVYGDANPAHENFDSMADFCYGDGFVEIKLPWQLLNFSNPSEMQIHDDYYEHYGVENMKIDRMYVGVGDGADGQAIPLFEKPLKGWGTKVTYHERLKESYYIVQRMWAEGVPAEELWREDAATGGETTDAVVAGGTS